MFVERKISHGKVELWKCESENREGHAARKVFIEKIGDEQPVKPDGGASMLDAPVSGGEKGAIDGTLSIMVGGTQEAFDRAKPLFDVMGGNIVLVGDSGAGQIAKACNQLVVGGTIEAVAEALTLATAAGVDAARVREALLGGFAGSKIDRVRQLEARHQQHIGRHVVTLGRYPVAGPRGAL